MTGQNADFYVSGLKPGKRDSWMNVVQVLAWF